MSDVILYGTLPNGEAVRVEANESGQLIAEGLQGQPGEPGQPGQPGQQGPPGPPGPPGDIYQQLPPDPWNGAALGWWEGELVWLGDEPIILPPTTVGPLVAVDNEKGILTCESDENFENLMEGLDIFMTDKDGVIQSFVPFTDPVTKVETVPGSWTGASSAIQNTWSTVAASDEIFVALAVDGSYRIMWSTDAITWKGITEPEENNWTSITYGNGKFVAVSASGYNRVMWSSDGMSWNYVQAAQQNAWYAVTYGGGKFVAVATNGQKQVMYSEDGISWTSATAPENNYWNGVTYGDGKFVAVADFGTNRVMYSGDGINWNSAKSPELNNWKDVSYGNGMFVAVATNGTNRVMYSVDGISWTSAAAPEQNGWYSITYGDGKFVAVSYDGTNRVMYSANAINWSSTSGAEQNSWQEVTYGNGKFVAVSYDGDKQVMWDVTGSGQSSLKLTVNTTTGGFLPDFVAVGDAISQSGASGTAVVSSKEENAIYATEFTEGWETGLAVQTDPKSGTGRILGTPSSTAPNLFLSRTNNNWYAGNVYVTQPEAKVAKRVILESKRLQQRVNNK